MKTILIIIILGLSAMSTLAGNKKTENNKPVPVRSVDLNKYAGAWYEIAKIPNRFQKKCERNTTANYTLDNDGRIEVVNRCQQKDGSFREANGIARIVDTTSNARLEVSFVKLFGFSLFWGDYWIIGLEENYQYAVVGTPNRKYGWILSRTPQITDDQKDQIYTILRNNGYDPAGFESTIQDM